MGVATEAGVILEIVASVARVAGGVVFAAEGEVAPMIEVRWLPGARIMAGAAVRAFRTGVERVGRLVVTVTRGAVPLCLAIQVSVPKRRGDPPVQAVTDRAGGAAVGVKGIVRLGMTGGAFCGRARRKLIVGEAGRRPPIGIVAGAARGIGVRVQGVVVGRGMATAAVLAASIGQKVVREIRAAHGRGRRALVIGMTTGAGLVLEGVVEGRRFIPGQIYVNLLRLGVLPTIVLRVLPADPFRLVAGRALRHRRTSECRVASKAVALDLLVTVHELARADHEVRKRHREASDDREVGEDQPDRAATHQTTSHIISTDTTCPAAKARKATVTGRCTARQ